MLSRMEKLLIVLYCKLGSIAVLHNFLECHHSRALPPLGLQTNHGDRCDYLSDPGSNQHHWIIQAWSRVFFLIFCSACDVAWGMNGSAWPFPMPCKVLGCVNCRISVLSWCWHFAGTAKGLEIHLRVLQQQSRIRFPSHKRRGDAGRCKDQWNCVKASSGIFAQWNDSFLES